MIGKINKVFSKSNINKQKENISDQKQGLEGSQSNQETQLEAIQDFLINVMVLLAEARSSETRNHIRRIQHYIRILAEKLRTHPEFAHYLDNDTTIELLTKAAPLHDIGNTGIPDRILLKPGSLTADEYEIMKSHIDLGLDIISQAEQGIEFDIPFLKLALEIIFSHHEKWDGTGYPQGISGNKIPISGRLMAVADVYDALVSRRVYKPQITHEQAMQVIMKNAGTHFDPIVVEAFCEVHKEIEHINITYADSEKIFRKKVEYLENAIAETP